MFICELSVEEEENGWKVKLSSAKPVSETMHNFLVSKLAASFLYCKNPQFQLGFLRHTSFLFFNSIASSPSLSESKRNQHKDDNFTVSYLISSCGLSPEKAVRVSKNLELKNPNKPNAVLDLLKNYGFSETQIAKFVERRPLVLVANAEKTLLPKLKFLHSIGVSNADLPKILIGNHAILSRSLNKCLIPRYKILKSVVRDDQEVVTTLKRAPVSFIYYNVTNDLVANMKVLRISGVSQASISLLVTSHPSVAFMKHSKFVELVKLAKKMGFDPLKTSFVSAIHVLSCLNKAKWESRLDAYKKWGWSRKISLLAFRKNPTFMSYTEERFTKSMNFLVKDMGWSSEDIARFPTALAYDVEKRLMPRCSIIKILKSKGLVKNHLCLGSFVCLSEENFLKTFVTKFQEDLPVLLDVYKGLIDHQDVL